jgi:hypothetical protein
MFQAQEFQTSAHDVSPVKIIILLQPPDAREYIICMTDRGEPYSADHVSVAQGHTALSILEGNSTTALKTFVDLGARSV